MRSRDGDVEQTPREDVRRGSAPADDGRTRRPHAAGRSLGAAQAELGDRCLGRLADARRLRGDERLEVHAVQKRGFEHLAFHRGTNDAHDRLVREHDAALYGRIDIDGKMEVRKVIEEARAAREK